MEEKRQPRKAGTEGKTMVTCPLCKGLGEVPREYPLMANPRAPATRPDRIGSKTCPKCGGEGRIGGE